jgi:DNA polymerase V
MGAFKNLDIEMVEMEPHALKNIEIPVLGEIECGFPSPATDYVESNLNLHEFLVKKPAATFFVRAKGDSMIGAGIYPGDLLIVDRSINPRSSHIVVASINGEHTLKRLVTINGRTALYPENSKFKPIEINNETDFQIFGVATHNIHNLL